jgi:hypothetical protein
VGWIDPFTKTNPKLLIASPNFYSNKFWILDKNKVLIKFKQALSYSWNNKNKTYKLIPYVVVRIEEKKYKSDICLLIAYNAIQWS